MNTPKSGAQNTFNILFYNFLKIKSNYIYINIHSSSINLCVKPINH